MFRLIPLMVAIYFLSFLDRTNIGMAKMALLKELGIGPAAYGLGAGIFFWGYALLEVPSNLIGHKVGPRRWMARIAVTWGTISACMMFVQGEWSFYTLRLMLGIAEAGLFPLLMYVTTLWFAQKDRAVAVGWIYIAPAAGLMIGSPIGGLLLQLNGLGGLQGWQWMFLLEGIPTVMLAIILWFIFPDRPTAAAWLTKEEAQVLEERAVGEQVHAPRSKEWLPALTSPTTLMMGIIYFLNQIGFVGLYYFVPSMVSQMRVSSPLMVGLMASTVGIGFLLGVLTLPWIKRLVKGDVLFLGILTACEVVASGLYILLPQPSVHLLLFVVNGYFAGGILPIYWHVAMRRLTGIQAAAGLACINTIGLMGAFVGPYLFGLVEARTGSSASGFYIIVITAFLGLTLIPALAKAIRSADARAAATRA
jgi:MFS family permease